MIEKQKRRIKIGHSLQQLEDNIILTLQDKPVIHGNQINEEQDILQNLQRKEVAEAAHNAQIKKKLKRIANAATSHLQAKNQGHSGILPHYDDYRYKNQEIEVYQQGTVIKPRKPKQNKNIPSDFLETPSNQIGNQYSKSNRFFDKKGSSISRSRNKTNVDELLNFLNETAEDNQKNINQNVDAEKVIDSSIDELRRKKIAESNLEKQVISKQNQFVDQDEDLLMRAMKKSRRIQNKNSANGLSQLLDIIKQQEPQEKANYTEIQLNPVTFKLSDQKIQKKDYSLADASKGKGTSSMMFCSLPSERLPKKVKKQESQLPESLKQITVEELQKMKKELQFMQDQTLNTGLAGTLGFLRDRNLLGKQQQVGRNTDKSMDIKSINSSEDRIKLQYRNASGKLMKPKEAFRYICSAFHGEGPGKNKIEKRRKKEMMEQKIKLKANSEGSLMQMLKRHQEKSNQAYMQLQIGKDAKKI